MAVTRSRRSSKTETRCARARNGNALTSGPGRHSVNNYVIRSDDGFKCNFRMIRQPVRLWQDQYHQDQYHGASGPCLHPNTGPDRRRSKQWKSTGPQLFRATDMRNEQSLIESDSYFSDVWADAQRSPSGFLRQSILSRWQRFSDTRRERLVMTDSSDPAIISQG
jgi:hypothetical protein